MPHLPQLLGLPSIARVLSFVCVVVTVLAVSERPASAQARDAVVNGAFIGAGIGAGVGVAFTHAVRDSDLTFGQYARGAAIFAAIGAGAGLAVDALFNRAQSPTVGAPRRIVLAPALTRQVRGITVRWRW